MNSCGCLRGRLKLRQIGLDLDADILGQLQACVGHRGSYFLAISRESRLHQRFQFATQVVLFSLFVVLVEQARSNSGRVPPGARLRDHQAHLHEQVAKTHDCVASVWKGTVVGEC